MSLFYKLGVFLFISFFLSLFVRVFIMCVKFRLRIANQMVMDSCCRGGIVNTRVCCSRVPRIRPESPKAVWRFRVSTSNSPSGRTWPHSDTPVPQVDHTYAQQDIRVCGDDHIQPPMRQFSNPKAL